MYKNESDWRPGNKNLVEGAVLTIFAHQIFDQINMDRTKVLLTRHVSENKRKRDAEKDHQQISFVSQWKFFWYRGNIL